MKVNQVKRSKLPNNNDSYEDAEVVPKKVKRPRKKIGFFGKCFRLFVIVISLVFVWCLYCYGLLLYGNKDGSLQHADAGIVLGAALWNNVPSPALRERLDAALTLYEEGTIEYLILSGGKGSNASLLSEAEGMRDYLVNAGIPHEKLLLEKQSTDTYENLLFSYEVAKQHNLNSFVIITHNYHGERAADIATFLHMENVQVNGVKTKVLNESYHYTREVLAYTKWQLNKLLSPLGIYI